MEVEQDTSEESSDAQEEGADHSGHPLCLDVAVMLLTSAHVSQRPTTDGSDALNCRCEGGYARPTLPRTVPRDNDWCRGWTGRRR